MYEKEPLSINENQFSTYKKHVHNAKRIISAVILIKFLFIVKTKTIIRLFMPLLNDHKMLKQQQ